MRWRFFWLIFLNNIAFNVFIHLSGILLTLFKLLIFKPSILNDIENIDDFLCTLKSAINLADSFLPLDAIDCGAEFETELNKIDMEIDKVNILKQNCFIYLKRLLKEMLNRLPENMRLFKVYGEFSILKCGNPLTQAKFSLIQNSLKLFEDPKVSLGEYELQWSKLAYINWKDYFKVEMPTNLLDFWPKVYNYSDAAGTFHFKEIALAVLNMLIIPTSNASVERVFSIMNCTKTRLRNKIQYELLDALLRIINYMNVNQICCNSFVPTQNMLKRFNANIMYNYENDTDEVYEKEVYDLINILKVHTYVHRYHIYIDFNFLFIICY